MINIRAAMKNAFNLGQTYWQQADSEYVSQQNKSDATRAKFNELLELTVTNAAHPPEVDKLLQQALEAQVAMQMEAKARNCGLKICDDSIDAIRTYLEGKK